MNYRLWFLGIFLLGSAASAKVVLQRCSDNPSNFCQREDDGPEEEVMIFKSDGKVGVFRDGKRVESPRHIAEQVFRTYNTWQGLGSAPNTILQVLQAYQALFGQRRQSRESQTPSTSADHASGDTEASQTRATDFDSPEESFVAKCARKLAKAVFSPVSWIADGVFGWQKVPYQLKSQGDTIRLSTTLRLDYPDVRTVAERESLQQRMDGVLPCMKDFFSKHGIDLDLKFEHNAPGARFSRNFGSESIVNIRENGNRGSTYNNSNWAFSLDGNVLQNACLTMVHELGHLLGLKDEYADPQAPYRKPGPDDSVMKRCHCPSHEVKFNTKHLKQILGAAC